MSDDDKEPQRPFDPFIRFKNHVNSRIGTGVSVLTGAKDDGDKPSVGDTQDNGPRRQSPIVEYWKDWCHVDPYSPHNLRHLPQPTPTDLPSGVDPADFGYPEAFEDLMSACNPALGDLMDLSMRAGLKRTASGAPVKPETPSAWVRRLYGDGLLPHPFNWEQHKLDGGIPRRWEAHVRRPFGTQHTPEHDHDPTSDIAKEFLDTIRRVDGIVGESFSKMEELMGQDMADIMRKAQKFAETAMSVFSEQRSEDHDPNGSHAKLEGDAKSVSVSKKDQPATEQDLYEFIQHASSEADKFINDFLRSGTGRAPQTPERASRDNPPVSERVEHDPYGGKTIRTSSEHVDMFGFIHSKTEVRRLNAKGETIDYDTRYSVRSGPRGDRPPQPEYRPRSDAPVSAVVTPEQYRALLSQFSDEQLRALKIEKANEPEQAVTSQAGQGRQDYLEQSRLPEEQDKRGLVIRDKAEVEARPAPEKPRGSTNSERSGWFWR